MEFLIKPLEGIYWEDKSILLKNSIENVLSVYGNNYRNMRDGKVVLYLFESELQIYFDVHGKVEYIMFGGGFNIELEVSIYGVNPFKTKENELFWILKDNNNGEIGDDENGYSYVFKNISVGIWRESKPETLAEFIDEINNDDSISQDIKDKNICEETIKSSYWETIGIGIENYYES